MKLHRCVHLILVICPWSVCVSVCSQFVKLYVRPKSVSENWQDLVQGIAKCHLSLVEAFGGSEFEKKKKNEIGPYEYFD